MTVECRLVLAGILAFAGCASAPKQPAENPAVPAAEASATAHASGVATASGTERAASDTAAAATTDGVPSVEVSTLTDTNPVTCRDLLIQGSNVLRTQCMTRNDWKVWDQAQRLWAQDLLLRMQGFKR
jgi:uncharacterized lipoprotein YajG